MTKPEADLLAAAKRALRWFDQYGSRLNGPHDNLLVARMLATAIEVVERTDDAHLVELMDRR